MTQKLLESTKKKITMVTKKFFAGSFWRTEIACKYLKNIFYYGSKKILCRFLLETQSMLKNGFKLKAVSINQTKNTPRDQSKG